MNLLIHSLSLLLLSLATFLLQLLVHSSSACMKQCLRALSPFDVRVAGRNGCGRARDADADGASSLTMHCNSASLPTPQSHPSHPPQVPRHPAAAGAGGAVVYTSAAVLLPPHGRRIDGGGREEERTHWREGGRVKLVSHPKFPSPLLPTSYHINRFANLQPVLDARDK